MKEKTYAIALSLLLLFGVALAVEGDAEITFDTDYKTITTEPVSRESTEVIIGTPYTGNYIPWWGSNWDACRFQVLFLQSEINYQGDIVTFSWRPSSNAIGTFDNVRIYMCHTSASQLGSTFDANYTGNTPVELINVPSMPIGGTADQWWNMDVYFPYNNTDNLLVEVRWNTDGGTGIPMYRTSEAIPRRLYADNDNASTGTTHTSSNYVRLYLTPPAGAILYVDDDNDAGVSGYFETSFSNLGYAYDMWVVTDSGDVTPDAAVMGNYNIVVWTTGDDYSSTFVGNDTIEVANYLNGGGKMWLSSEDVLWDLGAVGFLHVGSFVSDIGCTQATGIGPVTTPITFPTTGGVVTDYSDEVQPDGVTWAEMQNETNTNNTIAMDAPYYLFFNAFAFENINAEADRDTMMYRVIEWLGAPAPDHDVGCFDVVSPPAGPVAPANYDVIGWIRNVGNMDETFDVVAHVYDTVAMSLVFDQTINLTLTAGADTNLDFGQVTFGTDMYFMTEIYTMLAGDVDPSNDTSTVYSRTAIGFPDIIFELDAQAACNDNQLLGIEFDGEYFYITGGGNAADPNKVYVVDTAGTLLWALDQPAHSTGWGWRDLAWDDVYAGPDRIDTLYASVNPNVDYFSIDLTGGNLVYHGFTPGAQSPNRALAYYPDSGWFYTANFSSSCYKFNKAGVILQNVANTYAMYGAGYDPEGDYVWWHSQDDPGTGFLCQLSQMDPYTMAFTGLVSGYAMPAALTDAIAGGLCYYHGFRGNMDVLFALLQGTPNDYIVGILVRTFTGIEGKPGVELPLAFGFAPSMATVTKGHMPIAYTTNAPGHVSLKVYDGMGRLVQTLVNTHQSAGEKSIHWDNKDLSNRTVANGVYFLKLEAENQTAVHKLILVH